MVASTVSLKKGARGRKHYPRDGLRDGSDLLHRINYTTIIPLLWFVKVDKVAFDTDIEGGVQLMSKAQSKPSGTEDLSVHEDGVMMVLKQKPAALKSLALPADAQVAIVSKSVTALQKVREQNKQLTGQAFRFFSEAAKKTAVVNKDAFAPNARALAVLEGVRIAQEDLRRSGGAYDLDQVRTLLRGISRQAVDKRVQEGSLLAVPGPSNHRSFPTLQFNVDGTVVEGLKSVQEALPTNNPWTVLNFLAQPDDRLGGRKPIDLLREGKVELVVEAARRMAQQGA